MGPSPAQLPHLFSWPRPETRPGALLPAWVCVSMPAPGPQGERLRWEACAHKLQGPQAPAGVGLFPRERWGALCGGCPCVRLYEGQPHRPARGHTVGTCVALAHRHPTRLHPLPWPQLKVSFRATLFVSKLIGNTFWQRETWHFGRLRLCAQAAGESPPQCCLQGGGQ